MSSDLVQRQKHMLVALVVAAVLSFALFGVATQTEWLEGRLQLAKAFTPGTSVSEVLLVDNANDDPKFGTQAPHWILAGDTKAPLAAFKFEATTEDMGVDEYSLKLKGSDDLISQLFSSISIYDQNGTLMGTQTISNETDTVTFRNATARLIVPQGKITKYYVLGNALPYGKNQAGHISGHTLPSSTWSLSVSSAKGLVSNQNLQNENVDTNSTIDSLEIIYGTTDNGETSTGPSRRFDTVASMISNVAFVPSHQGVSVDTALHNGDNTVAILALTTRQTANRELDGTDIESVIRALRLNMNFSAATTIDALHIEMIGTPAESKAFKVPSTPGSFALFQIDKDFTSSYEKEIDPGVTVYFEVIADLTLDSSVNNEFVQAEIADMTGGAFIKWDDSDESTSGLRGTVFMGSQTKVSGPTVSE